MSHITHRYCYFRMRPAIGRVGSENEYRIFLGVILSYPWRRVGGDILTPSHIYYYNNNVVSRGRVIRSVKWWRGRPRVHNGIILYRAWRLTGEKPYTDFVSDTYWVLIIYLYDGRSACVSSSAAVSVRPSPFVRARASVIPPPPEAVYEVGVSSESN